MMVMEEDSETPSGSQQMTKGRACWPENFNSTNQFLLHVLAVVRTNGLMGMSFLSRDLSCLRYAPVLPAHIIVNSTDSTHFSTTTWVLRNSPRLAASQGRRGTRIEQWTVPDRAHPCTLLPFSRSQDCSTPYNKCPQSLAVLQTARPRVALRNIRIQSPRTKLIPGRASEKIWDMSIPSQIWGEETLATCKALVETAGKPTPNAHDPTRIGPRDTLVSHGSGLHMRGCGVWCVVCTVDCGLWTVVAQQRSHSRTSISAVTMVMSPVLTSTIYFCSPGSVHLTLVHHRTWTGRLHSYQFATASAGLCVSLQSCASNTILYRVCWRDGPMASSARQLIIVVRPLFISSTSRQRGSHLLHTGTRVGHIDRLS